jgi:CheY-like chemotaxis protein
MDVEQNYSMADLQTLPKSDSRVKVLVVDDHPNTANMLARAISRLGPHVEVVSATSGYEALQHVEDRAADILITDMMMPEMTGMELIETLNDTPATSPAAIFLLTAHDSAGVREIAQRLHVKQVIAKPVHPEWICELVSKTMDELKLNIPAVNGQPHADTAEEHEEFFVTQLLWDVARKYQPQADIKNQLLVVGQTDPDSKVRGNATQLRQALRSLVWTAIQNTPKGGTVILSSEQDANMAKIIVRDTGYGNQPANLAGVLDDSDQFVGNVTDTSSENPEFESIRTIALQHGGDVVFESEPGKGSCFTLSLPLVQPNTFLGGK